MEIDLLGLLEGKVDVIADQTRGGQPRVYGVVVAVVTSVDDREQLGRVRVRFSFGGRTESAWARVASPWAGPMRGAYFVPEVDDEVLLAFADGKLGRPYVLGFLWSQPAAPPESSPKNGRTVIRSTSGHTIELNDNEGLIALRTNSGCRVVLNDSGKSVEIGISQSKGIATEDIVSLTLDGSTGGVSIDSNQSVSVTAPQISLEATGMLTLKGKPVSINS